ncbi:aspartyl protease, putative [Plasmodium knowlesi strain H]|uniref:Aspartyl protease, putative n=3 Tax=Plasmodium knowlesi TaxID=5850 RepID=A0A5K1USM7_PLAKH|nr:aspartyl protease, putative [Plasmodium knowlesi strain H]OTN68393.1 putative Aspartyl protease [Plasmodium knowlesi]CAA9987236.1 aspartyl protease, putative [Plasmodium knowlesi strain H]SBO24006.1 aspartyl protease, putative [Plasmodium knowlesi strain H]SBO26001.1 aspartyl protease, putative [Plasmodium knowlesi strain H]VVS76710.1 aspartyl protease, putative [Plasmodium knowlesi strain H]|eukprot:XP_002261857.1 aspartyl protease, putative [Plasmodium knowlesi strain H]
MTPNMVARIGFLCLLNIWLSTFSSSLLKNTMGSNFYVASHGVDKMQMDFPHRVHGDLTSEKANQKNSPILIKLIKEDIPSKKMTTYYGQVAIGEKSENVINVLFDTGSTEFWIPFENCRGDNFPDSHNKYKRTKSFKNKFNKEGIPTLLEINYLSGKIIGFDGYDTIKLGANLSVPNTNIAFATKIEIPVLEEFKWDGILGLGFENADSRQRGIKPFLDHLKDENILTEMGYKNQFGYYLSDGGGFITFGGVDNRLKRSPEEEVMWSPVSTDMGFWTIDIMGVRKEYAPDVSVKGKVDEVVVKYEGFHDGGKKSIVDTGTFFIYAPKRTMEGYLNDLKVNSCEDKEKLPYIVFQIKSKGIEGIEGSAIIELVMSPNDYVIEYLNEENWTRECVLGIEADEHKDESQIDGWTLGQIFIKSYYTIFDKDNLQIGFVRSKEERRNNKKDDHFRRSFLNLRTKRSSDNARQRGTYSGPLLV